jgi:hypothetical protein
MKAQLLAASAAVLLVAPNPAWADDSVASGRDANYCGFLSVPDSSRPGYHVGVIHGGPVNAGFGAPGSAASSISIRCSLQDAPQHSSADLASGWSTNGIGVSYVPPTVINYPWLDRPLWICTEATIDGSKYFWDAVNRQWSPSSGVACMEGGWIDVEVPRLDDYTQAVDELLNNTLQQCRDGVDNDLDGLTDYPNDPGCRSPYDVTEVF